MAKQVEVPDADAMPFQTFHKHMNLRHVDIDGLAPYTTRSYKDGSHGASVALHDHLHRTDPEKYDHVHYQLEEL